MGILQVRKVAELARRSSDVEKRAAMQLLRATVTECSPRVMHTYVPKSVLSQKIKQATFLAHVVTNHGTHFSPSTYASELAHVVSSVNYATVAAIFFQ
jgi:hypothetical protein